MNLCYMKKDEPGTHGAAMWKLHIICEYWSGACRDLSSLRLVFTRWDGVRLLLMLAPQHWPTSQSESHIGPWKVSGRDDQTPPSVVPLACPAQANPGDRLSSRFLQVRCNHPAEHRDRRWLPCVVCQCGNRKVDASEKKHLIGCYHILICWKNSLRPTNTWKTATYNFVTTKYKWKMIHH